MPIRHQQAYSFEVTVKCGIISLRVNVETDETTKKESDVKTPQKIKNFNTDNSTIPTIDPATEKYIITTITAKFNCTARNNRVTFRFDGSISKTIFDAFFYL